jgi:predicted transcriptional regulator
VAGNLHNAYFMSKKDTTIGVRVDEELLQMIQELADNDDRPLASMARKLILEALKNRDILPEEK